ncbi:MAG TPA: hypothetical protein VFV83_05275, partial [Chthoniobacteraceae bacterium]|nr:hypothetical protein [Chthoniobacteraceae bacterium]
MSTPQRALSVRDASSSIAIPTGATLPMCTAPVPRFSEPTIENRPNSIREALAGDDPFKSAERVLAWLPAADAETFRKLGEESEKFPHPSFSGFEDQFRSAFFEAIAERWLSFDAEGALVAMQRIDEVLRKRHINYGLIDAVARLQPQLVLARMPLENKRGYLEPHTQRALGALAERDLNAAHQFAERWQNGSKLRKHADSAIAAAIAADDPVAAVNLARKSGEKDIFAIALLAAERIGIGMVRQVLHAAGDQLGPSNISPQFVLAHPAIATELPAILPPSKQQQTWSISDDAVAAADRLSPAQRERLLADSASLPESLRDNVSAALVSAWARSQPRAAADWS